MNERLVSEEAFVPCRWGFETLNFLSKFLAQDNDFPAF